MMLSKMVLKKILMRRSKKEWTVSKPFAVKENTLMEVNESISNLKSDIENEHI